jgi:site-specific DNA recombinase
MSKPILVALYLRASTDEQTESIPAQLMLLERYAKDHNMKIAVTHQDRGKSGDSFNKRVGLQQLLAEAKTGKFQQVLVRNLSRLSRRNSLKTAAQIVGPLLDAGVGVCTANQGDLKLDIATGRIVLAVLSEMENNRKLQPSLQRDERPAEGSRARLLGQPHTVGI